MTVCAQAKLQQELLSKNAPTDGKRDALITRLLELTAQEASEGWNQQNHVSTDFAAFHRSKLPSVCRNPAELSCLLSWKSLTNSMKPCALCLSRPLLSVADRGKFFQTLAAEDGSITHGTISICFKTEVANALQVAIS